MKINFYILGKKGYVALHNYISYFGSDSISHVIAGQDEGVEDDYFDQIEKICHSKNVAFSPRDNHVHIEANYSFAIGWKWMLKNLPNLIVFHDSILPKYRGFSPLVNMLINGEDHLGVTALIANESYDKGDIIGQEIINITYPLKISTAIDLVTPLYSRLVINITKSILTNTALSPKPQDDMQASYSLWRDESDYLINWNSSAIEIKRFIDAVGAPFKGAATHIADKLVRVLSAELYQDVYVENRVEAIGKIIFMENKQPIVVCANGLLRLDHIVPDDGHNIVIPFRTRFE